MDCFISSFSYCALSYSAKSFKYVSLNYLNRVSFCLILFFRSTFSKAASLTLPSEFLSSSIWDSRSYSLLFQFSCFSIIFSFRSIFSYFSFSISAESYFWVKWSWLISPSLDLIVFSSSSLKRFSTTELLFFGILKSVLFWTGLS